MENRRETPDDLIDHPEAAALRALGLYFDLRPGEESRYDERSLRLAREDMAHHVKRLVQAELAGGDAALRDYLSWLKVLFRGLSISDDQVADSLRCAARAAAESLREPAASDVLGLGDRAADLYARLDAEAGRYGGPGPAPGTTVHAYVRTLVDGRRDLARKVVDAELDRGVSVRDLYLDLFQPAQREIGRLWHTREISVAQEHFATAATQYLMSELYPRLVSQSRPNGRLLVAAAAQGELHEIGIRMVADFFQAEGWDTRYFGANLPADSLLSEVDRLKPDLVALSATLPENVRWISRFVESLRSRGPRRPAVLVGGLPFLVSEGLWRQVGADATGSDCREAVDVGTRLAAEREGRGGRDRP